ncbi:MAG: AsnC family protein [Pseudomonadota bacterium]
MVGQDTDRRLLEAIEDGLPLVSRPYGVLGKALGIGENEVRARLARLQADGTISRFGVVVRHHELGYRANCMVVWDIPDERVDEAGRRLAALPFVTLCYRRPRRPPTWPYNLFCMIHGRDRGEVETQVADAAQACGLTDVPRAQLFSTRRFKQRGASYREAG